MKYTDMIAGAAVTTPALEADVLLCVVQANSTRKLTLAQALGARQPLDGTLTKLAALSLAGDGYLARTGGVWALAALPGSGVYEPVGAVAAHNISASAHSSIAAHPGTGGGAHALSNMSAAGFLAQLPNDSSMHVNGLGAWETSGALQATLGIITNQKHITLTGTIDLNQIISDPVAILGLANYTRYKILGFHLFKPDSTLAGSAAEVSLGTTSAGVDLSASAVCTALTSATKITDRTLLLTDELRTEANLYVSCKVVHGSAMTVKYCIWIMGLA
jgi:hypothetical protein